jgi:hypothetical protein
MLKKVATFIGNILEDWLIILAIKYYSINQTELQRDIFHEKSKDPNFAFCAGTLEQSKGASYPVGIGLSYRPARLHRLAESIPWNRFLGSLTFGS